jgi:putative transposase
LSGVSTRSYAKVLPEMSESVGLSRSAVSASSARRAPGSSGRCCERRLNELETMIVSIDGIHMIVALGVAVIPLSAGEVEFLA